MRLEIILSSIAAVVSAQGVTQYLAPKGKAPKGCQTDLTGKYELSVAPLAKKQKRMAFEVGKTLQITLKGGVLTDALSRTGYIADNYQFQFDGPPQAGSIYTGGWSLCNNGSLALGPSTVFYQCLSGSFYNLYDRWWAQQCSPINIVAHSLPDGAAAPAAPALTASPDPLQSGSPDLPPGLASPSSPAKATSDAVGGLASVTLTNGAAPGAATTGLGASASVLSSIDSSISSASSVSSSLSSSAASSLSSVSSSIKSSASSARSSASASASTSNNGVQVGGTGASTVALLMGVIGMVLA